MDIGPVIHDGPAPPKNRQKGKHNALMQSMGRGQWVVASHAAARGLCAAARDMGGRATMYRVSETQSCVKVIEAPWQRVVVHRLMGNGEK